MNVLKAFESVHRGTLWELLRLRGITRQILELIRALYYTGTDRAVRWGHIRVLYCKNGSKTRLRSCVLPVQRLYGMVDGSNDWLRAPGSTLKC